MYARLFSDLAGMFDEFDNIFYGDPLANMKYLPLFTSLIKTDIDWNFDSNWLILKTSKFS